MGCFQHNQIMCLGTSNQNKTTKIKNSETISKNPEAKPKNPDAVGLFSNRAIAIGGV